MWVTERIKGIEGPTVQNLTTSGTAAVSAPINPIVVDPLLFVRISTTAAAYFNTIPAPTGSFTINANAAGATAAIPADSNAAAIQAALVAVLGAGKTTVTGSGTIADPFLVTFIGTLGLSARTLTIDQTLLVNETATAAVTVAGSGAANQQFSIIYAGTPVVTAVTGAVLPAGATEYLRVPTGGRISALQVTAAGVFSIAVVNP